MISLILASQSPRRRELLALTGYPFQVVGADVDESRVGHRDPAENSRQTARLKALAVAGRQARKRAGRLIVVAADTNVVLDDLILGKPSDAGEARQMLAALRGRTHLVNTGMALFDLDSGREFTAVHTASVLMRPYSDQEIDRYIASGDPLDKAGAYGIQHPQFRPVAELSGCYLGVMGLSVCQLLPLLEQFDVSPVANLAVLKQAHHGFACPYFRREKGIK